MKRISRTASTQIIAGFVFTLGGLLLMSTGNRAYADGRWVLGSYTADPNLTQYPCTPGSSAIGGRDNSGGCSISCTSNFTGAPGEDSESASAGGRVVWTAEWINSDGKTGQPDHGIEFLASGSISGAANPIPAASATSASGNISGSAPSYPTVSSYNNVPYTNSSPQSGTPQLTGNVTAKTNAGPDWTGDPTQENPPNGSAADATGAMSVQVTDFLIM